MIKRRQESVTHRPVSNRRARKIAEEPEMKKLKAIMTGMDETERSRTRTYLNDKGGNHANS